VSSWRATRRCDVQKKLQRSQGIFDMRHKVVLLALGAASTSVCSAEFSRKLGSVAHAASNPRSPRTAEPLRKRVLHLNGGGSTALTPKNDGVGMAPSIFNLMKNILGAGVLALPAGVAAFSDSKTALVPALALTATLGLTSGYCFATIGRLCESTLRTIIQPLYLEFERRSI